MSASAGSVNEAKVNDSVLKTVGGYEIQEMALSHTLLLDKSIAIIGSSGSGKTVMIKAIMKAVHGYIDQVIIVSTTELSNKSYDGFVDSVVIHDRPYLPDPKNPHKDDGTKGVIRFIEAIWNRQEMLTAIYMKVNDLALLGTLYEKIKSKNRNEGDKNIRDINEKRIRILENEKKKYADDIGKCDNVIKTMNGKFDTMLKSVYKKYIEDNIELLWKEKLDDNEKYILQYINFNPKLLIIFDDCAAMLKPIFTKECFRKLFYQNRHNHITIVWGLQDDIDIPSSSLRKNLAITFFTTPMVCQTNFTRSSNGYSKQMGILAGQVANQVFIGYRKLAYVRDSGLFYHITAPYVPPFKFGSKAFREICDIAQSKEKQLDKNNPYYKIFNS